MKIAIIVIGVIIVGIVILVAVVFGAFMFLGNKAMDQATGPLADSKYTIHKLTLVEPPADMQVDMPVNWHDIEFTIESTAGTAHVDLMILHQLRIMQHEDEGVEEESWSLMNFQKVDIKEGDSYRPIGDVIAERMIAKKSNAISFPLSARILAPAPVSAKRLQFVVAGMPVGEVGAVAPNE